MTIKQQRGYAATLYGNTSPADDGEITQLQWIGAAPGATQLLLGNGVANITYQAAPIPTLGCTQLAIGVQNSSALVIRLRIKGLGDDDAAALSFEQGSVVAGAAAAGVQPWTTNTDEFSWEAGALRFINIPWAWHFARIGVYAVGAPGGADKVTVNLERSQSAGASGPV